MPSWWEKLSSKDLRKKTNKEGFIDTIQRKLKNASEEKCNTRSGGSQRRCSDTVSDRGFGSRVPSRSQSPTTQVSRCQSFAERSHAQPLPLPGVHLASIGHANSGINAAPKLGFERGSEQLILPHPRPRHGSCRPDPTDTEVDVAAASISSDSTIYSDDPSDSRFLNALASEYENGYKTTVKSPSSVMHKDQYPVANEKNSMKILKPSHVLSNNQILSTSPKQRPLGTHVQNLQIPPHRAFGNNPDSSLSSPSRSPMRVFWSEQAMNCGYWTGKYYPEIASGQCSSPGSGYNSGHNSIGGDWSGQLFWPHSRCSPECSPIPSPRMASPGPSSRIQSGAVTPLHPRAGAAAIDSPTTRPDDGKQQSHCLPLPPLTISNSRPFSPTYSAATTPSIPRSPGRAENPTSTGSRWKKGRLLGRGTCGHVYAGFNSESGEMCAMKEVTLFSDDPKSKESAQQLGQEIQLLSRLRHPNIVQYYGSETVDDTLYIYLEFVSGGSIYKLLQEYGQFGEVAIRSYTQQILSGLAYLHAKNTVHRDIKGANILVDPSGKVKLADFGMAKHITGQSCPLSFKGSPHWMAPELFKNSSGCHLAVDIWSLGCTVIEMATTKPPWSQFEGVAALFKIGNSRELPPIPDHLSEDGKDFVKLCLQRDPSHRPTAAQLLEHPFVKNAAPLERSVLSADPSDALPSVTKAVRPLGIGNAQGSSVLDSGVRNYHNRGSRAGSGSSDAHALRNISCPLSPGSPILHSRSPQHMSGRTSPSPISSPHTTSGSSTPLTGGSGAIPLQYSQQPITYVHEGVAMIQRSQNNFYANGSTPFHEPKPDLFRGMSQASHAFHGISSSDNGPLRGDNSELYEKQMVLADHVSQQLLREHLRQSSSLELKTRSLMVGRNKAI